MGEMHTTVMGMDGALGKMNLISSNLPRRRQFSASPTLDAFVVRLEYDEKRI